MPAGAARTGGKLGLAFPIRTLPLSAMPAGAARTGGKLGLAFPIRTFPLSSISRVGLLGVAVSLVSIFINASSS
jgi:hypothetical protein